ncbi:PREDICTED: crossover junction endonuclease MUS81 isoform X1 [Nicotiana attenuata]|uniref:Crossover junction endonuclease MUS81 n=1 Tax=Nicotiana attenuata TaxID=49451 RepID=A0A314KZM4_NICAT|nr:PREDICTED: crossover junction endonuclease MUS81 isoform X1 [Nicotiana attenuata]OIT34672.1 crossover junction endonuclease mus81 [Nicotiana attenuata]
MEYEKKVVCPENEELAAYMWNKKQEMAQNPKGISDNILKTLHKAYTNLCNSKTPIKTLKEFSEIKGVGKWILRQMKGFFEADDRGASSSEDSHDSSEKGKRNKGTKRYMPQKNSVAYALLITLYRCTTNGEKFMHKQELIDATEASGLSRAPVGPEKGKGKAGQFGSPRDWYSGWSCMGKLIDKGLVAKSSCPAKYMLTEEGKEIARECLLRSRIVDSKEISTCLTGFSNLDQNDMLDKSLTTINLSSTEVRHTTSVRKRPVPSSQSTGKKKLNIPSESLDRFVRMGFSKEQVIRAYSEVLETSKSKDISLIWPSVLCRLREDQVYGQVGTSRIDDRLPETTCTGTVNSTKPSRHADFADCSNTLRACSSNLVDEQLPCLETRSNLLVAPPLAYGEQFEDVYEVVLVLDDREQFTSRGSRSRKIIENISTQFKIEIEVRRLPVGDAIWIARNKVIGTEYVLDFIVERKNVEDLQSSIRDNRYRDQKLRILRCGLKKMIYVVEGDPNSCTAADSIKTACFTTEILEGFDVLRTSGLGETLRKYGYLTQAINQYYKCMDNKRSNTRLCPRFNEFIRKCEDLDKMTVSDVFATQLVQVPQVTEEVAIAVLDMYPTLSSLAGAYSLLDGDVRAQEEMLKEQSNNIVNATASKKIFELIWSS